MVLAAVLAGCATPPAAIPAAPIQVKAFVAAMYERYWMKATPIPVPGALTPVFCNPDGVCGSILGMGKVNSSLSMQAILLNPQFDFSNTHHIISGVVGTPPQRGTIGEISGATLLVDCDLGRGWAPEENKAGEPTFMPRKGYENYRRFELNAAHVAWAMKLSADTPLKDSAAGQAYRQRYPDAAANRAPFVGTGTDVTGDTFFHGPGMSEQAQYVAKLYGADDYIVSHWSAWQSGVPAP